MYKKIGITIAAGAFALAPSLAHAYTGVLISCTGSPTTLNATVSPGLTCTNSKNVIKLKTVGHPLTCAATAPVGNWDVWKAGATGNTLKSADAPSIGSADLTLTAKAFGSCNFGGSGTSAKAWGAGTVKFETSSGGSIGGATTKFTARVAGDLATTSAQLVGIVTGGPGAGGTIFVQAPLSVAGLISGGPTASPYNGASVLATCNLQPLCTADPFGNKSNATCTGAGAPNTACVDVGMGGIGCSAAATPYPCCTGHNTGNCVAPVVAIPLDLSTGKGTISFDANSDCTAASAPYLCCTGAGTGTCN